MNIHGAKWWKFDFHTHSPASKDFGYGNKEIEKMTPREWLLSFMKKEIDCIAITDHNNGEWVDVVKSELSKMEEEQCNGFRKLHVFPGIELNVNGNIHLLCIFPNDFSSTDIVEVLGAVSFNKNDDCTTKSFVDVLSEISKKGGIPIPAHVDKDKGLFKIEGPTLKNALREDILIAMELNDTNFSKPQIYQELKMHLTEVIGSDCHLPEQIGTKFTWVKMEQPCIEALWLALHDGEDGIKRSDQINFKPNDIRNRMYLQRLEITNGVKIGRGSPFIVNFNPWMTTIIGGRGSGKSSLLNFIRLPLNLDKEVTESLRPELDKFFQISKGRSSTGMLLPETMVSLELWKDERLICLEWKNNEINEKLYDFTSEKWIEKGKSKLVQDRFPVRIFSQKELYEITGDPNTILKLIDNQYGSTKIQDQLKTLKQSWLDSKNHERKLQQLIDNQQNVAIKLEDIDAKIKILESSENEKLLKEYKEISDIDVLLNKMIGNFEDITLEIKSLSNLENISLNPSLKESIDSQSFEMLKTLSDKSNVLIEETKNKVNEFNSLLLEWNNLYKILPWSEKKETIILKYNKLAEQLNNETNLLEDYQNLINEKQVLQKQNMELNKLKTDLVVQKEQSTTFYNEILNLNKKIRNERLSVIKMWNKSNSNINITLVIMGDLNKSEKEFRDIIRKSNEEYKKDILDYNDDQEPVSGILNEIATAKEKVWDVREKIIEKISNKDEDFSKYFIKHIENIKDKTPEDLDRLRIWFPEDRIIIKLKDENGKLSEIDTGSAGQKSAALLSLILSIDNVPLIIDQPEDDLDTKRITDLVVNGLRDLKLQQQIIVVTHNPNIPVNGGAEQIIHLGVKKGNIQPITTGALQKSAVRHSVCEIMEGGKEALDNRYHRISNALDNVFSNR